MPENREPEPDEAARLQALIEQIESWLPLKEFGFDRRTTLIARFEPHHICPFRGRESRVPTVIYDSRQCRVSFVLIKTQTRDELVVAYGRSHAPDDDIVMLQDGKQCRCWHTDVYRVTLKFLDGASPREAAISFGPPAGLKEFVEGILPVPDTLNRIELTLRHAEAIWSHYGERLFQLFDLKNTDQWEQYKAFVREYYDRYRNGQPSQETPPEEDIC